LVFVRKNKFFLSKVCALPSVLSTNSTGWDCETYQQFCSSTVQRDTNSITCGRLVQ